MKIHEQEILWGERGRTITEYSVNDYGDQPKKQTAQWRVSPTHKGFNLEKV